MGFGWQWRSPLVPLGLRREKLCHPNTYTYGEAHRAGEGKELNFVGQVEQMGGPSLGVWPRGRGAGSGEGEGVS